MLCRTGLQRHEDGSERCCRTRSPLPSPAVPTRVGTGVPLLRGGRRGGILDAAMDSDRLREIIRQADAREAMLRERQQLEAQEMALAARDKARRDTVAAEREAEAAAKRKEGLELIAKAKAVEAERKHRADVAWAERVLAGEESDRRPGRAHIPIAVRHSIWQRDGGRCKGCRSSEKLEYDHIIPVSLGGSSTERNLQLLCERCNRRKAATLG